MGGIVLKSAGIGSAGGPVGAIFGGLFGLGAYGVYKVFTAESNEKGGKVVSNKEYNKLISKHMLAISPISAIPIQKNINFIIDHPLLSFILGLCTILVVIAIGSDIERALKKD